MHPIRVHIETIFADFVLGHIRKYREKSSSLFFKVKDCFKTMKIIRKILI